MDVVVAGLVVHLVGVSVWWLRLRWQLRVERERGVNAVQVAERLRGVGGSLRERRADGSVTELVVRDDGGR